MSLLSWFDNRTLYGCQCMLAVMFAVLFLWMSRVYPSVRGVRSVMWAFLLGIPCTFLLLSRGHIFPIYSVVLADLLSIACFLLLYDGILRFVGGERRVRLLTVAAAIAMGVVFYATEVKPAIVPRVVAMGLFAALMRGLTARELLRGRSGFATAGLNRNTVMQFFGVFMAALSALGVIRVSLTLLTGNPDQWTQRNTALTSALFLNVAYIGVYGLCFLTMAGHEMILRSQEESEKDLLSGVFNRRGIEARLSIELKRSNRGNQRLSIALVDIDHFKSINDEYGHARGDTAIRDVASAISRSLRDGDYLGRYGGDEFLVILPITASNHAAIAAERLSRAVNNLGLLGAERRLTLSIGLTEASPEDDAMSLIARADEALYRAKSEGRSCLRALLPEITYSDAPVSGPARAAAQP